MRIIALIKTEAGVTYCNVFVCNMFMPTVNEVVTYLKLNTLQIILH
jgi:hypothetical protein